MENREEEQERASFLANGRTEGTDLSKSIPVEEVKYDLSKNYKKRLRIERKAIFLAVCDHLLILTVVSVNVVAFWRGTFGIFAQFQDLYHMFFLYLMGSTIICHFSIARNAYKSYLRDYGFCSLMLRKGYTYAFGCACAAQWAGLWYFLDAMTGLEAYPPVTYSIICSVILLIMKLFKNILAVPVTFTIDHPDEFFEFPTAFNMNLSEKGASDTPLYILDCFFSVFVIGGLVIFVWRGVWCLIDVFLYPDDDKYSAFGSLAIGYGVLICVFCVQIPMETICEKLTGFWRLLVADVYVFIAFFGTLNLWRGFWNLLNIYFLPETPVLSCWITHLGSFAFLVLINCSNSTLVRGVYIDGEDGGKCVAFPVSYLRLIFKKHLDKKTGNGEADDKKTSLGNVCAGDVEKGPKETSENGTCTGDVEKSPLENSENGKSCVGVSDSAQEAKS